LIDPEYKSVIRYNGELFDLSAYRINIANVTFFLRGL